MNNCGHLILRETWHANTHSQQGLLVDLLFCRALGDIVSEHVALKKTVLISEGILSLHLTREMKFKTRWRKQGTAVI